MVLDQEDYKNILSLYQTQMAPPEQNAEIMALYNKYLELSPEEREVVTTNLMNKVKPSVKRLWKLYK